LKPAVRLQASGFRRAACAVRDGRDSRGRRDTGVGSTSRTPRVGLREGFLVAEPQNHLRDEAERALRAQLGGRLIVLPASSIASAIV
jgi:hypothetical protein